MVLSTTALLDSLGGSSDELSQLTAHASTTLAAAGSKHGPEHDRGSGECELLGPFALLVQGALGIMALSSLVWKRYHERPQRPLKVWGFDVSKQVVGSVLLHIANLLMSMLSAGKFDVTPKVTEGAGKQYQPNPCSFYLLNLAIDTTIGIPILIVSLRLLTHAFALTPLGQPPESIRSGNYGQPPKAAWWAKQSIIYFLGLLIMKSCVLFIFSVLPWISRVGDWALGWTEGNEALQVFFVMLFFPLLMNAMQYYIIDSFIKGQKSPELDSTMSGDDDHDDHQDVNHGRSYAGARRSEDGLSFIPEEPEEALAKDMEGTEEGTDPSPDGDRENLLNHVTRSKPSSKGSGEEETLLLLPEDGAKDPMSKGGHESMSDEERKKRGSRNASSQ